MACYILDIFALQLQGKLRNHRYVFGYGAVEKYYLVRFYIFFLLLLLICVCFYGNKQSCQSKKKVVPSPKTSMLK